MTEGNKISSIPKTGENFISPEEQKLLRQWEEDDREYEARRKNGWLTAAELAEKIGIEPKSLSYYLERTAQKVKEFKDVEIIYKRKFSYSSPKLVNPVFFDYLIERHSVPKKAPDWLSKKELAQAMGLSIKNGDFNKLWQEIEGKGAIGELLIKSELRRGPKGRVVFCIHKSEIESIKSKSGLEAVPIKTESFFGKSEFAKKLGISPKRKAFYSLWKEAEEKGTVLGKKVQCDRMKSPYTRIHFCIHESAIPFFLKAPKLEPVGKKTKAWCAYQEFASLVRVDIENVELKKAWKIVEETGKINEKVVRGEHRKSGSHKPFCIHKSEASYFRKLLGSDYPTKTNEWLSKKEVAKILLVGPRSRSLSLLWKSIQENKEIDGKNINCQEVYINGGVGFCIHKNEVKYLKNKLGVALEKKTEKDKAKFEFSKLVRASSTNPEFAKLWSDVESSGKLLGKQIKCGMKKPAAGYPSFCIDESEVPLFRKLLKTNFPDRVDGWEARGSFAGLLGTHALDKYFISLWEEATEQGTVLGKKIQCGTMLSSSHKAFYVHQSEADLFKQVMAEMKAAEIDKPNGKVKRNSIEITPDKQRDARGYGK